MDFKLLRIGECSKQTMSRIVVGDYVFTCPALELPWRDNKTNVSRIPEGVYPWQYFEGRFGPSIRILNVPGRSNIVVHYGNFVGSLNPRTNTPDSRGCPLPGEAFVDIDGDGILDVTNSKTTMTRLIKATGKEGGFVTVSDRFLKTINDNEYLEFVRLEGLLTT